MKIVYLGLGPFNDKKGGWAFWMNRKGVAFIPLIVDGIFLKEPIPFRIGPFILHECAKKFEENLKDFQ